MAEQIIHSFLLALHNIALVGCAAAPFYNRALVLKRAQYGTKLFYELDKVVEDTLQGNAPYCIVFIATLFITGIGIPLNHYAFVGSFNELSVIAWTAVSLKLLSVFGMMVIMFIIFFQINPKLRELFAQFKPTEEPSQESETKFFTLRARRKVLCDICLKFAISVLVFSAFIGFTL
ncbi:MAG: hypothetical protein GWP19_15150 [Planctomycetia bacterium]|nr:hypothetical protein [Planctomycetia bacterium]